MIDRRESSPQIVQGGRVRGMVNTGSPTHSGRAKSSQHVARAAGGTREVGGGARFEEDGLRDDREFLEFDVPRRADDLLVVGF